MPLDPLLAVRQPTLPAPRRKRETGRQSQNVSQPHLNRRLFALGLVVDTCVTLAERTSRCRGVAHLVLLTLRIDYEVLGSNWYSI